MRPDRAAATERIYAALDAGDKPTDGDLLLASPEALVRAALCERALDPATTAAVNVGALWSTDWTVEQEVRGQADARRRLERTAAKALAAMKGGAA